MEKTLTEIVDSIKKFLCFILEIKNGKKAFLHSFGGNYSEGERLNEYSKLIYSSLLLAFCIKLSKITNIENLSSSFTNFKNLNILKTFLDLEISTLIPTLVVFIILWEMILQTAFSQEENQNYYLHYTFTFVSWVNIILAIYYALLIVYAYIVSLINSYYVNNFFVGVIPFLLFFPLWKYLIYPYRAAILTRNKFRNVDYYKTLSFVTPVSFIIIYTLFAIGPYRERKVENLRFLTPKGEFAFKIDTISSDSFKISLPVFFENRDEISYAIKADNNSFWTVIKSYYFDKRFVYTQKDTFYLKSNYLDSILFFKVGDPKVFELYAYIDKNKLNRLVSSEEHYPYFASLCLKTLNMGDVVLFNSSVNVHIYYYKRWPD
jgi:hypothetical protein